MWEDAKELIRARIRTNTDVNTKLSKKRYIVAADVQLTGNEYQGLRGFIVRIGNKTDASIQIPWDMLQACYNQMNALKRYDGEIFKSLYSKQHKQHGCHVHVVGQIFVRAGLATQIPSTDYIPVNHSTQL